MLAGICRRLLLLPAIYLRRLPMCEAVSAVNRSPIVKPACALRTSVGVRFTCRRMCLAVAISVVFAAQQSTLRGNDQDWAKRLREEAPAAWDELREFYTHLECALVKTE